MNKVQQITYKQFLDFFPLVEPPIVLSKDNSFTFSKENKPIPGSALNTFFVRWGEEFDEYTEVVPCIRLKAEKEYQTLIYWKASLLIYEYILITLDKNQQIISRKVIAGVISDGQKSVQSAATIQEDLTIHIASGELVDGELYNAADSKHMYMEILPSGEVITINEENYVNNKKEEKK